MIMNISLGSERVIYWMKLRIIRQKIIFFLGRFNYTEMNWWRTRWNSMKLINLIPIDTEIFVVLSIFLRPSRAHQSLIVELIHHDFKYIINFSCIPYTHMMTMTTSLLSFPNVWKYINVSVAATESHKYVTNCGWDINYLQTILLLPILKFHSLFSFLEFRGWLKLINYDII